MNALLIYPEFPDTFWSFKHALKFLGKRAAQPPLGLMTVAALLPGAWKKRLVDTNVERLRDRDLAWADVVLLSGMHIQRESLVAIVERCRARGLRTVVGGPIASSLPAAELKADHVVIGEAESLIAGLARDLEQGTAKAGLSGRGTAGDGDQPAARPEPDQDEPLLDHDRAVLARLPLQLRVLRHYRDLRPAAAHQGRGAGAGRAGPVARGGLARIGVYRGRQLYRQQGAGQGAAARRWPSGAAQYKTSFDFITEASLNLADDPELMQLMKDAGFNSVFLGIETPDESGLIASNKLQNTRRSLLESVATIQSYGMQVMGGFILGFDTDKEDIFDRMVEFIQKSGIPIAMVGLLQAMPGTQLFRRLRQRGPDCGRGRRQQHLLRPAELSAPHGCGEAGGGLPLGAEEDLHLRGLL